jgi:polyisoprenoid-binding protein YceI
MLRKQLFTLGLLVALGATAFAAEEYKIDPAHSSATFTVRHLMISNVPGRFSNVNGTIIYDEKEVTKSSVTASIPTATINTENEGRDKHLKNADFFDVEKFPEIKFVSKRVEQRGSQLVAIGDLTIKDVTKQVELPFEVVKANTPFGVVVGATGSTKINRKDYNVLWSRSMDGGGAVVGDEVKIEFSVEAKPAKPAANKPTASSK